MGQHAETATDLQTIILPVGTYLGVLPFLDERGDVTSKPTLRRGMQLTTFELGHADVLNHVRRPRTKTTFDAWCALHGADSAHLLAELTARGAVVIFSPGEGDPFGEVRLDTLGTSLGRDDSGGYNLLNTEGNLLPVSESTFWLWVFAGGGQSLAEAIRFVLAEPLGGDEAVSDEDLRDSALLLLLSGLARLEPALT